jgi:hypothetical protein
MSKLDKAKATPTKETGYDEEDVELGIAFLNHEINAEQFMSIYGQSRTNAYWRLAGILRWGAEKKILKVSMLKKKLNKLLTEQK